MDPVVRLIREPLLHFAVAGAVLFAAFRFVGGPAPESAAEDTIVVDRRALLTFMQYRASAFAPETFAAALDSLSEAELQALIDAYVEEEALYREAKALGLEESDYVIRQRMVQKVKFLLGDAAGAGTEVDEAALGAYFRANKEAYAIAPAVTFTHVFFDVERRGEEAAAAAARAAMAELNTASAGFNDAPGRGDRFPFLRNYVERTFDYVASHFGAEFAEELAQLPAGDGWSGPLRSAYGLHVVLVTSRTERGYPALADVRDDVERDYLRARTDEALAEVTRGVVGRFEVEVRDLRAEEAE